LITPCPQFIGAENAKTATSHYKIAEYLRTPEEMATCLEVCLEKANGGILIQLFKNIQPSVRSAITRSTA
jgi:DNA-binding phage protein